MLWKTTLSYAKWHEENFCCVALQVTTVGCAAYFTGLQTDMNLLDVEISPCGIVVGSKRRGDRPREEQGETAIDSHF